MAFSIRLSEEDEKLIKTYVVMNGMSISEFARKAMIQAIEDEFDLNAIREYEEAKSQGNIKTRPIEEFWKEMGL